MMLLSPAVEDEPIAMIFILRLVSRASLRRESGCL